MVECDSPEFMRLSSEPIALLGKENTRQTRPGIIVLANLLSYPVSGVMNLFPTLKDKIQLHHERVDQERADKFRDNLVPNYVAYIILNFLILMGGLVLFVRILGGGRVFVSASFVYLSLFI